MGIAGARTALPKSTPMMWRSRVAHERIERSPAEQLEALCNARDYYTGLAETLHNRLMTSTEPSERDERHEKKARRFAAAYDRSVKIQRAMIDRSYS